MIKYSVCESSHEAVLSLPVSVFFNEILYFNVIKFCGTNFRQFREFWVIRKNKSQKTQNFVHSWK